MGNTRSPFIKSSVLTSESSLLVIKYSSPSPCLLPSSIITWKIITKNVHFFLCGSTVWFESYSRGIIRYKDILSCSVTINYVYIILNTQMSHIITYHLVIEFDNQNWMQITLLFQLMRGFSESPQMKTPPAVGYLALNKQTEWFLQLQYQMTFCSGSPL